MLRLKLGLAAAFCGLAYQTAKDTNCTDAAGYTCRLRTYWDVSPDVRLFRFQLPHSKEMFHMPCCSTLEIAAGGNVSRQYTPVNPNGTLGYFDLLVKRRPKGIVTNGFLWNLRPGDTVRTKLRHMHLKWEPNKYENLALLCAGVGLTPMLQLLREVVTNPYDHTKVHLLYCNRTEEDILLREELDRIAADYPDQVHITHVLTMPSSSWNGLSSNELNASVYRQALQFDPSKAGNVLLCCGPGGFLQKVAGVQPEISMERPGHRNQPCRPRMRQGVLTNAGEYSQIPCMAF